MKEFKEVNIKRKENNIIISINDNIKSNIEIYYNNEPISNGNEKLITSVTEKIIEFKDPRINKRTFYILKADGYKDEIIGERVMPLEGLCNFRDLGGIESEDGRKVKWNKFFRAEQLSGLTKSDMEFLNSIGIKTILDYRSKSEVDKNPDPEIKGATYINISGLDVPSNKETDNFDMIHFIKNASKIKEFGNPIEFLGNGYTKMVFNNNAFKKLIDCILNEEMLPIIQHCTAGKDRTGMGSALILLALGVSEENVIDDYLATNVYREKANNEAKKQLGDVLKSKDSEEMFDAMMQVRREYIENAFKVIKEKYNTIDNYLEKEYDLTSEKRKILQDRYLY